MTSYGLPYQGSKNTIAKWVLNNLPKGNTLVEPFFGGGSITHYAIEHNCYNNYIANDLRGTPHIFLDVLSGRRRDLYTRFIWPEEFMREKHDDLLISLLWSFSCSERSYLYGKKWVHYKYAIHKAIIDHDFDLIAEYYTDEVVRSLQSKLETLSNLHDRLTCASTTIHKLCKSTMLNDILKISDLANSPASLCSIQHLDRMYRLQKLESIDGKEISFSPLQCDYRDLQIPTNAVIYCDPPYVKTSGYRGINDFDSKVFLDWAVEVGKNNPVYISEFNIDDPRFVCVSDTTRFCAASGAIGKRGHVTEKLYTVK